MLSIKPNKWTFNSWPTSVVCWYSLQTIWTQIRPNKMGCYFKTQRQRSHCIVSLSKTCYPLLKAISIGSTQLSAHDWIIVDWDIFIKKSTNIAQSFVWNEVSIYAQATMSTPANHHFNGINLVECSLAATTVVPAKSDSDVVFCLQLLSKTLTCTLHLS